MNFKRIITHPGSAHKDELLACALLLTEENAPIFRRDPTPEDLEDPSICVVDVGGVHNPEKNNYDHHQFAKGQSPTCSISLVLEALGLYQDAREFLDWIEPAEWFDCRGPNVTANFLGTDRQTLAKLNSPIDGALLRAFGKVETLAEGDFLWETLKLVGEDIVGFLRGLRTQLQYLSKQSEIWRVDAPNGPFDVLYLPRSEAQLEDPTLGLGRYIESLDSAETIAATIYPDRRSEGYGLSRFRDDPRFDFTRIDNENDVHFTHASGFLAKTSATEVHRLRELLNAAMVEQPKALDKTSA